MRKKSLVYSLFFQVGILITAFCSAIHSADLSPQQRFQNNGAGFLCGRL